MLRQLNSLVMENVGASGFYFTLAAARIPSQRKARWSLPGGRDHPPAMIVRPGAALLDCAEPRSMILGTLPHAVGPDATLHADLPRTRRPHRALHRSGLWTCSDARGEMLGVEGVGEVVRAGGASSRLPKWKQGISQSRHGVGAKARRLTTCPSCSAKFSLTREVTCQYPRFPGLRAEIPESDGREQKVAAPLAAAWYR